ncbi:hypothetical protein QC764_0077410, partial [Podospora pseudoanserina]
MMLMAARPRRMACSFLSEKSPFPFRCLCLVPTDTKAAAASTARPTRKKVAYATDIHEKCWKHDESLKKRNGSITLPSSLHKRWGRTVGNDYCCPKNKPVPYKKCHWVGSKDCAVPNCERHEIFLATNDYGDADYYPCNWWRKKALCCEVNEESLSPVAECNSEI